ncbi:hypothetical protein NFA_46480 [Nocardia farcinica IFM 10152]|uniref:Nuclease SbcCD subunit C n=1 Tax=Nocardia farcinica (strain IFM 10152) TaxID=247156 RepID=Q5YQP2_NOCFA|nr:hypothetical protein NFA_46480 [Nocardia farcinica IFM 10152]
MGGTRRIGYRFARFSTTDAARGGASGDAVEGDRRVGWKRVAGTAPAAMVARRIADDPTVPPDVRAAVLDALGATDAPPEPAVGGLSDVFLRAIRVRGFRGIGAETELALRPGPGLTLVVGRNGCGKSSFAEAAELALTGGNRRWDGRSAAWREGWRNLHDGANPRIELELLTGAAESAPVVVKEWTARAELHEARWVMRGADGDPAEFDADGWAPVLELYRPFLSYSELGALVDGKPSDLFDALHQLLGLDDLIAAHTRLRGRRLEQERAVKQCRQQRLELRADLAAVADDRAARLLALLDTERPDLAAVDREVRGGAPGADGAADLRAIVALTVPSAAAVAAVTDRLTACARTVIGLSTPAAEADLRTAELLRRARDHVGAARGCPCPVCGQGALGADWAAATDETLATLSTRCAPLLAAYADLRAALHAARALPEPPPPELVPGPAVPPTVDTTAALRAWRRWAGVPAAGEGWPDRARPSATAALALAEELLGAYTQLADELAALRNRTVKELERLEGVWAPLTPRLAAWLDLAREVSARAGELRTLRRAEEWLKGITAELRDERMAPLETQARWVWQTLRQQSNVELGGIRLQGTAGSARRVLLDVTVDEVDGAALGVMSQGELHALGLSLFLPRATVADSPFRFVMIDDPVQAMDPAKVDGLATVLATVARTRQVVVFTHDERLAEAVRRMELDAHVLEVQRRERSVVEVRTVGDPVRRYLDDARSLVRTPQLPPAIADELVATCCRSAVEAAALARARRELLAAGLDHRTVERHVAAAHTTRAMVALAVMGVDYNVDHLNKHLARDGRWLVEALRDVTAGAHVPIDRGMRALIADTERFIAWLRR